MDISQVKEDLVSIIVPVYNVESYLQNCINSIMSQTYQNIEVLLIDDGSHDGSGAICDAAASKDSRITVIHKINSGVSDTRNIGIDRSQGNYICFVDSDDIIAEYYVETLLNAIKKSDSEIIIGEIENFSGNKYMFSRCREVSLQIITKYDALKCLIGREHIKYVIPCNRMIKKELLRNHRFLTNIINEDEEFMYQLYYDCEKIAVIDTVIYGYRKRDGSIMNSNFSEKRLDYLKVSRNRISFFEEKKEDEIRDFMIFAHMFNLLTIYPRVKIDLNKKEEAKKLKKEFYHYLPSTLRSSYLPTKKKLLLIIFSIVPGSYAELMRWKVKHEQ